MARKDFHFDFNEDADPVEELHRLRAATAKHFKTVDALVEYHNSVPPAEEIKTRLKAEITLREAEAMTTRSRKNNSAVKTAGQRKRDNRLAHV